MRYRRVVAGIVGALAVLGLAAPAMAEPGAYAPVAGICLRPLFGPGSLVDLPLVNIPGGYIPREPIKLVLGGDFTDCRP